MDQKTPFRLAARKGIHFHYLRLGVVVALLTVFTGGAITGLENLQTNAGSSLLNVLGERASLWLFSVFLDVAGPKSFDPGHASKPSEAGITDQTDEHSLPPTGGTIPATSSSALFVQDRLEPKKMIPDLKIERTPIYSSIDFLNGYLTNQTWSVITEAVPWENGSVNFCQLQQPGGGTSYWDYWIESEPWDSPNHMWRDEQGMWHTFRKEAVRDSTGADVSSYVLVDRKGPGVMDKLWFTHDAVAALFGIFTRPDPPEVRDWGNLAKLGNLRIQVDGKVVYDGPVQKWMSGEAQNIPKDLRELFVWRYGQFGSNGNIIPIAYQDSIKVLLYGGVGKPKWFMATGVMLPMGTRVTPYSQETVESELQSIRGQAQTILSPETFIDTFKTTESYSFIVAKRAPAVLTVEGTGTIAALNFRISKESDPRRLWLQVKYGKEIAIDLPLVAFFGEPDQISLHHSTPIGILDRGGTLLFYSNFPMPFQDGAEITLTSDSATPISVAAQAAVTQQALGTRLNVEFTPFKRLETYGPDYQVKLAGSGKIVGMVLVTKDEDYDAVPRVINKGKGKEDGARRVWPMGYLEGNLTIQDGVGNARYYSGQEDWAEGGYYFNSGFTVPPGGANRPFAGVLRYRQGGNNGYATLFRYFNDLSGFRFKDGVTLSFGHGTYSNNYSVTYGSTVFYYSEIPGAPTVTLPASDYELVTVR